MTLRLKLCCVLVLTTLTTVCAYAQIDPVSPTLAAPLTTDPETAPITTLAIDLLAPQRPYIFDPSGASVIANALNPAIYSSSLSSAPVQTDTQVRDSSQTGHLSPYAAAANRLGLSFSDSDAAANQDTTHISNGSFRGALPGENGVGDSDTDTDNAYQSSWGTSSSFGTESTDSSWGTKRLRVDRLGRKQPESLARGPKLSGEVATTSNSTGSSSGYSVGNSDVYPANNPTGSFVRTSNGGFNGNSANNLTRRSGASSLDSLGYALMNSRTGRSYTENTPGAIVPVETTDDMMSGGAGGPANGTGKGEKNSAPNALAFFPQADYAPSPLGESPFSSPGGVDELHFLNPNIFAATSQGRSLSLTETGTADQTQESLRQAFVRRHTLATSASHYGLATHPAGSGLKTGLGDKLTTRERTHLNTGISDSDSP